jgi:predicted class III extradiol MEMO1 family dioxygenase
MVADAYPSKRVFILGPSHHVYFKGARLSPFSVYETPLGNVPVDRQSMHAPTSIFNIGWPLTAATDRLSETGIFKVMTTSIDEDEHSFEMHMPFLYKMSAP